MVSLLQESRVLVVGIRHSGFDQIRHSIGAHLLSKVSQQMGLKWQHYIKAGGSFTSFRPGLHSPEIILFQPIGIVNSCGFNVQRALSYFEIEPQAYNSLYVVHDEMELKLGRFKYQGPGFSLKGHNGLKSIESRLGHNQFNRFKIGIGRPKRKSAQSVAEWVMGNFSEQELRLIEEKCLGQLENSLQCGELSLKSEIKAIV